jgi:hypothetical protein
MTRLVMKKRMIVGAVAAAALGLGGCGDEHAHEHEHESVEAAACAHMQKGPWVAVAAGAEQAGAPAIAADHRRYDVALAGGSGWVAYASEEEGEVALFLDAPASMGVFDGSGTEVAVEAAGAVEACAEVAARYAVEVGVGTYYVRLEAPGREVVSVVVEAGHEHEHDGHAHE